MTTPIGKCRRTQYSKEVTPELNGKEVTLTGWIHEIRDLGGIIFVLLRDRDGIIQITAPSKKISPELFEEIRHLKKESVLAVNGIVQDSPKAPGGVEIIPQKVNLLNESHRKGKG